MESIFPRHCKPTPVLMSLTKGFFTALPLFLFLVLVSCSRPQPKQVESHQLLKQLNEQLQNAVKQLDAEDSATLSSLQGQIEMYSNSGDFKEDTLVLAALQTARLAVTQFSNEHAAAHDSLAISARQLADLEADLQNSILDQETFNLYLQNEKRAAEKAIQTADYLTARLSAQKLLLETLEKASHKK